MIWLAAGCATLAAITYGWAEPLHWEKKRNRGWLAAVLGVGGGVLLLGRLQPLQFALGLISLSVAGAVVGLIRGARRAKQRERVAERSLEACSSIAADLNAGQTPQRALDRVASQWPDFEPVATAGRIGADIPLALRALAQQPGAEGVRTFAAAWSVASQAGSGLAHAAQVAAADMRAQRRVKRVLASELAAAHATARMLAALPLGVLAMGQGMGGRPFAFLFHNPFGLACLALGASLGLIGLWWIDRIGAGVMK